MGRRFVTAVVALAMIVLGVPFGAQVASAAQTGTGSIALTAIGATVGEPFDSLATTGTSSTVPAGWYFDETGTNANTTYTGGTGSSNAGDTYSFGSAASTERAFGQLRSGSVAAIIGASFTNNTGSPVTSLDVRYVGEQWRAGVLNRNAADRMDFSYSTNATSLTSGTYTAVSALSFSSPNISTAAGALDGNAAANRTAIAGTIAGLNIPNGATFWIRWTDFDISSSDDGLAVDEFFITPRTADPAPAVAATTPASGASNVALSADLTFTFSEPVAVTGSWYAIACAASGTHVAAVSGGPTVYTLDPAVDFVAAEACTVTVSAAGVSDLDTDDPPDQMAADFVFSFTTVAPTTFIHDIQGASHISPKTGQAVFNVPGIVTAKRANGFYMQDPAPDADEATSEAIFVFTSSTPSVSVGDAVKVNATVTEFRPGGASTQNLTTTELTGATVTLLSTGNALPPTTVVGVGGRVPPTATIEDDATSGNVETSGVFDPATDGIDFWESLEAMRVEIHNAVATGPSNSFNEISILADDGAGATGRTARGGIAISATDRNPEKLVLDDEILKLLGQPFPSQVSVGDHFVGQLIGVIDYNFGLFMLELTGAVQRVPGGLAREVAAPPGPNEVTIATFNVENLDPSDASFATLASLIVNNLRSPDILSLEEIQDNDGATNSTTVDATVTLTKLRDAVVAAGGPTYEWRLIDPVDDQDGGEPGGNIRQAFFFRTDRGVAFVDRPGASSTTPNSVVNDGGVAELQFSPGRIDPTNPAFNTSRKPLAGEFTYNGSHLILIANHWNSKGGDDPLWGRRQPPVLSSETQRMQQAAAVRAFVQQIFAVDPNTDVVVLGDLNDFEWSNPLQALKSAPLYDLIETLPANERYSYVFEGNSQTLDHILVSGSLKSVTRTDVVHVNAEFWDQASDHDPQVATLFLADVTPPTLTVPVDVTRSTGTAATSCVTVIGDAALGVATATDNAPGTITITRTGVPNGNVFPVGDTYVTYTATDASGNQAIAMQKITVIDDARPVISAPANAAFQSISDVPAANATDATASDNCGGVSIAVTESNNGGAGSTASPLVITRTYTATDASGNTASATQTITVVDTTAPTITAPADVTRGTGAGATSCVRAIGDAALGAATAHDNAPGLVTITRTGMPAGNVFPHGTTVVTYTATDAAGNTATATQNVTVVDDTKPVIAAPADASYQLLSQVPAANAALATATDNCGTPGVTVSETSNGGAGSPASPLILTRTFTATDAAGNAAAATQAITVIDDTPPTISAPADLTVSTGANATSCATTVTAAQLGTPTASDNSGHVTISGPAAGSFLLGTTTVVWTATDAAGNTASATQRVTVIDDTVPTLTVPADVVRDATGTLTFVSNADLGIASATDNCAFIGVTRTGVPAGNLFPPGTTVITYAATDGSGNTTAATQRVTIGLTETSLCALTRTFVASSGIANSLCAKLSAAAASLARGNLTAHENQLDAFIHEVEAQRGKAISDANATSLIDLAAML